MIIGEEKQKLYIFDEEIKYTIDKKFEIFKIPQPYYKYSCGLIAGLNEKIKK